MHALACFFIYIVQDPRQGMVLSTGAGFALPIKAINVSFPQVHKGLFQRTPDHQGNNH